MKIIITVVALAAIMIAGPAYANRNTEAALLGVIAGGVIVGLANQGRSHHHHHHHHGAPQGVINGGWNHPGPANLRGVCAITHAHQGQWTEVIYRNCHGDIILIERLPRY